MLIPIDISYIKPHLDNINSVFGTSRFFCQHFIEDSECNNTLEPLISRYNDVLRDYHTISHLIASQSKRSAWFSGIGTVIKHIFGNMDEEDAIKYSNAIQKLQGNDKNLASLIKENIVITKTAVTDLKETVETINSNEARLSSAVDRLMLSSKNFSMIVDELTLRSRFNEISNVLASSLLTLSFKLEDIISGIMFAKSHTLHPAILTPRQLFNELVDNMRLLPNDKEFPVAVDLNNIHTILSSSELVTYFVDNKIVFTLKIPLVQNREYNLYKNVPVPVPHDTNTPTSYAMIVPSSKYIAVSKDTITYTNLDDLNKCKIITDQIYICNSINVYSTSSNPSCETEIMTKIIQTLPEQCTIKFIHGVIDMWQQLQRNRWIYVQSERSKLSIKCDSDITEINLLGTGVLNLPVKCNAYCKNIEMYAKSYPRINVNIINSDFDLVNDSCCNSLEFKKLYSNVPSLKLTNINLDNLKELDVNSNKMLADVNRILNQPDMLLEYKSYYPVLTFCILVLICIVFIFVLYKKYGKCLKSPKTNSPKSDPILDIELQQTSSPRLKTSN